MVRSILAATLVLALSAGAALAQPAGRPQPGRPPAAQPQPPAPPPIFPCRTEAETCFLGIVIGSQLAVIYTNAENAAGLDAKPVDVLGADGAKADLAPHAGRVVMVAGTYDPKTGIKGEVVEVASPLVSLSIKAQLGAEGAGPPAQQPAPKRR
ncbi:hypothetical protein [Enterovirga aerilata]|uniref:Uncharacterized protein n=1 Tax=Enterovirga aerilata TaxID=2730920 RepID=A0A849I7U3_9HYPH|nr:hypothetical protein [Enterovirga sp. DB1703]NNM72479.1 hypothetical protein [Enterovirga sp. DB1703]